MVYIETKRDIMQPFDDEETVSFQIIRQEGGDYLVRLIAESGITKTFITNNIRDLFKD